MRFILEIWTTEIKPHIIVHIFTLLLSPLPPLSCSSGLGLRIIAAPRGLSPQYTYRVGRTHKWAQQNNCCAHD